MMYACCKDANDLKQFQLALLNEPEVMFLRDLTRVEGSAAMLEKAGNQSSVSTLRVAIQSADAAIRSIVPDFPSAPAHENAQDSSPAWLAASNRDGHAHREI